MKRAFENLKVSPVPMPPAMIMLRGAGNALVIVSDTLPKPMVEIGIWSPSSGTF